MDLTVEDVCLEGSRGEEWDLLFQLGNIDFRYLLVGQEGCHRAEPAGMGTLTLQFVRIFRRTEHGDK